MAACTGGSPGAGAGRAFSPLQLHNFKGEVTPPSPRVCAWLPAPLQHLQLTKEARGEFKKKKLKSDSVPRNLFSLTPLLS